MNEKQYILKWQLKNKPNPKVRHGKPMSKESAESWMDYANKEFPDFIHWIEEVE